MALKISQGSGATLSSDIIDGEHFSRTKISSGTGGATVSWLINAAGFGEVALKGNATLSDSKGYIGLVSVAQPISTTPVGNVTLSDAKTYIGLTTTTLGTGVSYVGLATVDIGTGNGVAVKGNVTLSDPKTYIGLTTTTLGTGVSYVGLATVDIGTGNSVAIKGNVTLSDPKTFIGLVTAVTRNAGTTKTLIPKTLAFAQASIVTIAVPSNTFNITSLVLNSNATVRLNIKSGATYLTGNATLGMNLVPGGGWVQEGSPDSPVYKGLAGAEAIVLEKADSSGVVSQIGGHLMYFDE